MFGVVWWKERGRVNLVRERILTLPVLKVGVTGGGRWDGYKLDKAARLLRRAGVRRLLPIRGFERWDILGARGLVPVDGLALYRAMAAELVMSKLEREGRDPTRTAVVLRSDWVDSDMAKAAEKLCAHVRHVVVDTTRGGEQLSKQLYRQYGAAVAPIHSSVCVLTVRFGGQSRGEDLVLCGAAELGGMTLEASGLVLPEELEPVPVLSALWQAGVLNTEQLHVVENKFP